MVNTRYLRGCSKMGLEYTNPVTSTEREVNPDFYDYDASVISSWGAKLVRVNLCKEWYDTDPQYRAYVKQWVDACASKGMKVILDCHYPSANPIVTYIHSNLSDAEADVLAEGAIQTLENAVLDFAYQPAVIGVEINEFWPMDQDANRQWVYILTLGNKLAQRIHAIKPSLLVFLDITNEMFASPSVIEGSVGILTEPNIVYAPHIYSPQTGFQWGTPDDGHDFMTYYEAGDYATGKTKLYHWLDTYYKRVKTLYNLPVCVTEFAGRRGLTQPLIDVMDYFNKEGWGYSYWTYHGPYIPAVDQGQMLLNSDWTTLSDTGEIFVEKLTTHISPIGLSIILALGVFIIYRLTRKSKR